MGKMMKKYVVICAISLASSVLNNFAMGPWSYSSGTYAGTISKYIARRAQDIYENRYTVGLAVAGCARVCMW